MANLYLKGISVMAENTKKWFLGVVLNYNFRLAKAEAIKLCQQYNRKYYVIQSSATQWRVFSTADVRKLKKMGVFKQDLTFKEMSEKSAFVCYPKSRL